MGSILLLGLLIGMKHALEADHVAAVASLTTRSRNLGHAMRVGMAWGLGHTMTLFAVGAFVVSFHAVLPERVATYLEFGVGIMLIWLGADVIRRLIKERIHFHIHRHRNGTVHFHAHSHAGEGSHGKSPHDHVHPRGLPVRALLVGLMHGMAGSAALILLTLSQIDSLWLALAYMALFGLGSMVGMAVLSVVVAVPLRRLAGTLSWAHNGLNAVVGSATIGIGAWVTYRVGFENGLLIG